MMNIETGKWPFCVGGLDHADARYKISFDDRNHVWLCVDCFEELKVLLSSYFTDKNKGKYERDPKLGYTYKGPFP